MPQYEISDAMRTQAALLAQRATSVTSNPTDAMTILMMATQVIGFSQRSPDKPAFMVAEKMNEAFTALNRSIVANFNIESATKSRFEQENES